MLPQEAGGVVVACGPGLEAAAHPRGLPTQAVLEQAPPLSEDFASAGDEFARRPTNGSV